MTRHVIAIFACLAVVIAARPAGAQDRWYDAYDAGISAVKKLDWPTAERTLKTAIDKGPKTRGPRVLRYGLRREPFYPEYYLALAYLNEGKAGAAAELFRRIEREGLVDKNAPEFGQLATNLQAAERQTEAAPRRAENEPKPAPVEAPTPSPPQNPPAPPARDTRVETRPADSPPPAQSPPVRPADNAVNPTDLEAAKRRAEAEGRAPFERLIAQGSGELAARNYGAARASALQARALNVDRSRADVLMKRIDVEESLTAMRSAVSSRNWVEGQRLAGKVRSLDPKNTELVALTARIDQGLAALAAGDVERTAMRAFYNGQYQQTVDLLQKLLARPGGVTPRVYFYSACSNAALAVLDKPNRTARLDAARDLFAKARPYASQLAADRKFISPKILQVLEGTSQP